MDFEEELDIKDLFFSLWRKKWIILGVTFIFLLFGLIIYGRENYNNISIKKSTTKTSQEKKNIELCYVGTNFMLSRGKSANLENFDINATYKLTIDTGVITNLNKFATSRTFLLNTLNDMGIQEKDVEDLMSNITIFGNGTSDIITMVVGFENEENAIDISYRILDELRNKISKLYEIDEIITIDGPTVLNKKEINALEKKVSSSNSIVEEDDNKNEVSMSLKKRVILLSIVRICTFLWGYCYY